MLQISRSALDFYKADPRVRRHIVTCLLARLETFRTTSSAQFREASFQLAVCYRLGFGLDQDDEKAMPNVLGSKQMEDLDSELQGMFSAPAVAESQLVQELSFSSLDIRADTYFGIANFSLFDNHLQISKEYTTITSISFGVSRLRWCLAAQRAQAFFAHAQWDQAEDLLVGMKKLMIVDHPDRSSCMHNLSFVYLKKGQLREATNLRVKDLETRKAHGSDHLSTLQSMASLASALEMLHNWSEAEKLYLEIIERKKKLLGRDHHTTLDSITSLASLYKNREQWAKAEEPATEALRISQKVFGAEHPATMSNMNVLASVLAGQRRYRDAREVYRKLKEVALTTFGAEHQLTLTTETNIANMYFAQGLSYNAGTLLSELAEKQKAILGPKHHVSLATVSSLAMVHAHYGRREFAGQLLIFVRDIAEKTLGAEHSFTRDTKAKIAKIREEGLQNLFDNPDISTVLLEEAPLVKEGFFNRTSAADTMRRPKPATKKIMNVSEPLQPVRTPKMIFGEPSMISKDLETSLKAIEESLPPEQGSSTRPKAPIVLEEVTITSPMQADKEFQGFRVHGTVYGKPSVYINNELKVFDEKSAKAPYLVFPLGHGNLKRLVVRTWSRDQGRHCLPFCFYPQADHTFQGGAIAVLKQPIPTLIHTHGLRSGLFARWVNMVIMTFTSSKGMCVLVVRFGATNAAGTLECRFRKMIGTSSEDGLSLWQILGG